jgi:hypothetical protein
MGRTTLDWFVVLDPSDTFTWRLFHWRDLETSAQQQVWPEGIVFRNQVTGEQRRYAGGQLLPWQDLMRAVGGKA